MSQRLPRMDGGRDPRGGLGGCRALAREGKTVDPEPLKPIEPPSSLPRAQALATRRQNLDRLVLRRSKSRPTTEKREIYREPHLGDLARLQQRHPPIC